MAPSATQTGWHLAFLNPLFAPSSALHLLPQTKALWWLCARNQLSHFPQPRLHLCAREDWQGGELWELPQHHLPSQLAVDTLER